MLLTALKHFIGRSAAPVVPEPPAPPAPTPRDGFLQELSAVHAQGWVRDPARPDARVGYEVVLAPEGDVLATGRADQFWFGLAGAGIGDGAHAFWTRLSRPLDTAEQARVEVRADGVLLPRAPDLLGAYEPILHVAMDVVDNCNLRCPFCLYDYAHTHATHLMTAETLDAALQFLPYTRDGEFWFSCLHEPTLHPELVAFVDRVPREYRRKIFYTTNLAKRMPVAYFDWLAGNGVHHINVSIESRDPAVYERMRKGARFRIFSENWEALLGALARAESPTRIRYIMMAYKSNLRELPGLVRHLLDERRAWQVEVRYTYDVPYIPAEFRAAEFLDVAEWDWLEAEMAAFPPSRIVFSRPPRTPPEPIGPSASAPAAPPPRAFLPGRYLFRLSWDGSLRVVAVSAHSRNDAAIEEVVLRTNVREVGEPRAFLDEVLPRLL